MKINARVKMVGCLLLEVLILAAATPTRAATIPWMANGVSACQTTGTKFDVYAVPDGSGGAIVVWRDGRNPLSGGASTFAQRLTPGGLVAPGWPAAGLRVSTSDSAQFYPRIARDGAGGAFVAWSDERLKTLECIYDTTMLQARALPPTGLMPRSAQVVDVNVDQHPDLVVLNGDPTLSVFLGDGTGSFATRVDRSFTGGTIGGFRVGDLDSDGLPDLVLGFAYPNQHLAIVLGNGTAGFGAEVDYTAPDSPLSISIGDVSGDGVMDVVTADYWDGLVSVYPGNGDGTLATRTDLSVGARPVDLQLADLDVDGTLDLVVPTYASPNGQISIVLGNGGGTWKPRIDYSVFGAPGDCAVGDVTFDGWPDVLVTDSYGIRILTSSGGGTFGALSGLSMGSGGGALVVGDFTGDGRLDVATASGGHLLLSRGGGDAGWWYFDAVRSWTTCSANSSLALGDIDRDGRPDIAQVCREENLARVFMNRVEGVRVGNAAVYAQHLDAAGSIASGWPADGLLVRTSARCEYPKLESDGSGGSYVVWVDHGDSQTGLGAVRVQHLAASGSLAPGWPQEGVTVTSLIAEQSLAPVGQFTAPDGSGGLYVMWMDERSGPAGIFVQRLTASGAVAAGWDVNGVRISLPGGQWNLAASIIADGAGGAFVTYKRASSDSLMIQRITAAGTIAAGWPAASICVATVSGYYSSTVPDDNGGLYVGWGASSASPTTSLYVQHLSSTGAVTAGWPIGGRSVGTISTYVPPVLVLGGAGHVIATWADGNPSANLRAQSWTRAGGVSPGWPAGGLLLCSLGTVGGTTAAVDDHASGVIAAWPDSRYGPNQMGVYASRVSVTGDVAVDGTADAATLDVQRLGPNPTRGEFEIAFQLGCGAPARLDVVDLQGRACWSREVGGLGAGRHSIVVTREARLAPGVYFIQLRQSGAVRRSRFVMLE